MNIAQFLQCPGCIAISGLVWVYQRHKWYISFCFLHGSGILCICFCWFKLMCGMFQYIFVTAWSLVTQLSSIFHNHLVLCTHVADARTISSMSIKYLNQVFPFFVFPSCSASGTQRLYDYAMYSGSQNVQLQKITWPLSSNPDSFSVCYFSAYPNGALSQSFRNIQCLLVVWSASHPLQDLTPCISVHSQTSRWSASEQNTCYAPVTIWNPSNPDPVPMVDRNGSRREESDRCGSY